MAKIDKRNLSKADAKKLIIQRRQEKQKQIIVPQNSANSSDFNVICLKHGKKYSADYVNKLYYGCKINSNKDLKFFCITEDPKDLDKNIIVLPLPKTNLQGWWYKPYVFSNELPLKNIILYIDLDVVITGSIDKLFDFAPGYFSICRDFNRIINPNYTKFNSSVMKFEHGMLDHLWKKFKQSSHLIMRKYHGDQDFIFAEQQGIAEYFPDQWIKSWKWEIRKSRKFEMNGRRGYRKLATIENVRPPADCCIAVFHGDPNPHLCDDPYIKETWLYKE